MAEKMTAVGWQGITLKVPADWSLVGVSGDEKKGYFRADGPVASAVEVRWSPGTGKAPDLMVKGREFLATLEKSCQKKKIKFSKNLKLNKDANGSVSFTWRGDRLGQGRLVYCPDCDRVMIAQVVSSRDESASREAPIILGSLKDHRDDGWTDWALYGLEFAVPAAYRIEKHVMMSGYLSLSFKKGARTLVVERWGLAGTLLAEDGLKTWYRKDAVPDIKGYKVDFEECEIAGHEGLKLDGRRSGIKQMVKAMAYSLTLNPHPKFLTGFVWHCPDSNRLFSVRATHVEGDDIAEEVRDLIECHSNDRARQ